MSGTKTDTDSSDAVSHTRVDIYIVDDDPGHVRLIEKNLHRSGIPNVITVFNDGESVLNHITDPALVRGPILIILDLNMPGISGIQVLRQLKRCEDTKRIPVIVLTTSSDSEEIQHCYDLGCNLFMTKPIRYSKFAEHIKTLGQVLQIVEPPRPRTRPAAVRSNQ